MILGCEGLANCHCGLQSLEVPVSSGNRWENSARQFVTNSCEKLGPLKSKEWCQLGPLLSETTGTVSVDVRGNSLVDKEEVSSDSKESRIDSEEIVLHLVLPYSPCKDQAELDFYKAQKKPVKTCSSCSLEVDISPEISFSDGFELNGMVSHDLLCQQNLAHSDADVFVELPVANDIFDGGLDAVSESASEVQEMLETVSGLEMLKPSVKDGAGHMLGTGEKEDKEGSDGQDHLKDSPEQAHALSLEDLSGTVEDLDTKMPSNLGTHGLRSLIDTDTVQKFKRRRLTTPVDVSLVKDIKSSSETKSPVHGGDEANGQSQLIKSDGPEVLCAPPDTDEEVSLSKSPAQKCIVSPDVAKDTANSGDSISKNGSVEILKESTDVCHRSDSSSVGGSRGFSVDRETVDQCISSLPKSVEVLPEAHGPKRREWLAQHHGDNVEDTTTHNTHTGFAGCVGGLYRYAIDNRPPAPHPGTVGDSASVQFCKVCGEREDANSSLICDECDQVFHMTCVNSRMKIVPRVDEWYCRPCKKMKKHREACGDSEPGGENKGWWREDAGIGKVERELMKMSNGKRTKVRIGPKYQAVVPDWVGIEEEVDLDDTLAEASHVFGQEVVLTGQEKQREQEIAEYNLLKNIWPKGWLPATKLPPNSKENWLQCMIVLWEEGETCPDGRKADKDIICGKWRRAPLEVKHNDAWECSCALVWDPRHADCAVPQELTDEEIQKRIKQNPCDQEAPSL
ncbi:hypothetical protein AXG93_942s1200 [Marchantia polymorpha subsp. ruderalis]|uniref:PHD-type domain-containing protein n=1 Tax=Marchantia polymorpha subsp. ruderalis TaxID=1480154 RepID=A0A176WBF5_MARPO|nr:hypothetical protein AXG93_942s1200 [Marchantia polymorpha subsp. ruderalis]